MHYANWVFGHDDDYVSNTMHMHMTNGNLHPFHLVLHLNDADAKVIIMQIKTI